jgi:predicted SpoU family rRNA methylase
MSEEELNELGWKHKHGNQYTIHDPIEGNWYFLTFEGYDKPISIVYAFNENPGLFFHFMISKVTVKNKEELRTLMRQCGFPVFMFKGLDTEKIPGYIYEEVNYNIKVVEQDGSSRLVDVRTLNKKR